VGGALGGLLTHRVPFTEAAEAYRLLDERPDETIGVLLEYG
jgi:threonine dehydrogenase-like Zn-dependent dehydrogenase